MMAATNSSRGVSPASLVATAKQVTAAAVQQCPPGVFCQVPDDGTIYTRPPDPPSTKHCSMTQWTWCKVRGKWCKCYADGSIRRMIYLPVPELYGWQVWRDGGLFGGARAAGRCCGSCQPAVQGLHAGVPTRLAAAVAQLCRCCHRRPSTLGSGSW